MLARYTVTGVIHVGRLAQSEWAEAHTVQLTKGILGDPVKCRPTPVSDGSDVRKPSFTFESGNGCVIRMELQRDCICRCSFHKNHRGEELALAYHKVLRVSILKYFLGYLPLENAQRSAVSIEQERETAEGREGETFIGNVFSFLNKIGFIRTWGAQVIMVWTNSIR